MMEHRKTHATRCRARPCLRRAPKAPLWSCRRSGSEELGADVIQHDAVRTDHGSCTECDTGRDVDIDPDPDSVSDEHICLASWMTGTTGCRRPRVDADVLRNAAIRPDAHR